MLIVSEKKCFVFEKMTKEKKNGKLFLNFYSGGKIVEKIDCSDGEFLNRIFDKIIDSYDKGEKVMYIYN